MRENVLHFIWQYQYFAIAKARTTMGEPIEVLKPGYHNFNAGPDFEQAKIKIGKVEWNGDVEVHVNGHDWVSHGHHKDEAYNKVVLHVVWQDNGEVHRRDGTTMPTLELKNLVEEKLLNKVQALTESIDPIPCSTQIGEVPELAVLETVHRALVKRLERKALVVMEELANTQGNWSEVAYRLLMRQMGMKVNGEPFYELARLLPYQLVRKYKHSLHQLEALLFGVSGFLRKAGHEAYEAELKKEYQYLAHKHGLEKEINPHQWKFMRLRPSNFPTLRMAQVASILSSQVDVFELFTEFEDASQLIKNLKVETSQYWHTHYKFGVAAKPPVPRIGKVSIDLLLLNVVAPLLAAYSIQVYDNRYMDKAIGLMEKVSAESNRIIKKWQQLGVSPKNGAESQGLIELYNEHCQQKACLTCGIGYKILNYKSS